MIGKVGPAPLSARDAKLLETAQQLEGVFVQQLMKAMRETVPEGGILPTGNGEEIFTAMFDERVAQAAASQQEGGLSAALFRQLRAAYEASRESNGGTA